MDDPQYVEDDAPSDYRYQWVLYYSYHSCNA